MLVVAGMKVVQSAIDRRESAQRHRYRLGRGCWSEGSGSSRDRDTDWKARHRDITILDEEGVGTLSSEMPVRLDTNSTRAGLK